MIFPLNSNYCDYQVGPRFFPWTVTIMTIKLSDDLSLEQWLLWLSSWTLIFPLNSNYDDYQVGLWYFPWTVTIMTIQLGPDLSLEQWLWLYGWALIFPLARTVPLGND